MGACCSSANGEPNEIELIWETLVEMKIVDLFNNHKFSECLQNWGKLSAILDIMYPAVDNENYKLYDNPTEYKRLQYAMRYCWWIYKMTMDKDPQNMEIIKKNVEISLDPMSNPGYFFGVDNHNKILLVCIRGTKFTSPGDILTDLHCTPTHVTIGDDISGSVHPGMYKAAQHIDGEISSLIHEYKTNEKYSDYEIIICGHSLGGGTASNLGLIWRYSDDSKMKNISFTVYSFAAPCIVDKNIRNRCLSDDKLNIISITESTDVVTRLGLTEWHQQLERVKVIRKEEKGQGFFDAILDEACNYNGNNINADSPLKYNDKQDSASKCLYELQEVKVDENELLYPIGRILWFIPKKAMNANVAERNKYLINYVEKRCDKEECKKIRMN
eukprot:98806_1